MAVHDKRITVYEHRTLRLNQKINGLVFNEDILKALQAFYGAKGVPYYSLIHNGVRFCEYVGVIQLGDIIIEVLPKADSNRDEEQWRNVLVDMVRTVGAFEVQAPSSSNLRLKADSVLELYFQLFVQEVEYLLHRGLVKKYRKTEGNRTSLKGSIQFAQHVQKNLVHRERFFVRHSIYDVDHSLNRILYQALLLLKKINTKAALQSRIGSLLLSFPEQQYIRVTEATFERISLNRKTAHYQKALEIAKLLLLNYHPDVRQGSKHMLALMFDMNSLWEQFIYVCLRKGASREGRQLSVKAQSTKGIWKPDHGRRTTVRPDLVLHLINGGQVVLDTKWKNLQGKKPSAEDLRQMYVYHEYFEADRVALVYPGETHNVRRGVYLSGKGGAPTNKVCSVVLLPVENDVRKWQQQVYEQLKQVLYPSM